MRFSPGCQCCGAAVDCNIAYDDFNRADGSPGADWDVRDASSTWAISSNKLQVTSSNALIINSNAHPDGLAEHWLLVSFTVNDDSAEVGAVVAYEDDDNYLFVKVYNDGSRCATLELWRRAAGAEELLATQSRLDVDLAPPYLPLPAEITSGVEHTLLVCIGDGTYRATLSVYSISYGFPVVIFTVSATYDLPSVPAGSKAGLLVEYLEQPVTFDGFDLDKHYSATNPSCVSCGYTSPFLYCTLIHDEMNVSASGVPRCDWEAKASGGWHADGYGYHTTVVGDILINDLENPDGVNANYKIQCGIKAEPDASGLAIRQAAPKIIWDYVNDNNFHFAEYIALEEYVTGEVGALRACVRFYKRDDGVDTLLKTLSLPMAYTPFFGTGITAEICVIEEASGTIHIINGYRVLSPRHGGVKVGIMSGDYPSREWWYNFQLDRHTDEASPCTADCEASCTTSGWLHCDYCLYGCVPRILQVAVELLDNDCNYCDTIITGTYEAVSGFYTSFGTRYGHCYWTAVGPYGVCESGASSKITMSMGYNYASGGYYLEGTVRVGSISDEYHTFRKYFGFTLPDCTEWDAIELDYVGCQYESFGTWYSCPFSTYCTGDGTTKMIVTSLNCD